MDHTLNFVQLIQSFRRGDLLHRLDEELATVIEAMSETGNDGEVTLKLPFKVNKAGQFECVPKITSKVPKRDMGTGIFFADDLGRLTRRDPNQMDIEDEIARRRAAEHHNVGE